MTMLKKILPFLLMVFVWSACSNKKCAPALDVSDIEANVEFKRFDHDLFLLDTTHLAESLASLEEKYPDFAPFFFNALGLDAAGIEQDISQYFQRSPEGVLDYLNQYFGFSKADLAQNLAQNLQKKPKNVDEFMTALGFTSPDRYDSLSYRAISGFINFPDIKKTYDTTQVVYGDISDIEAELSQAFKYFKYYFPERQQPEFIATFSEFSFANIISPSGKVVLGLEFFFGSDYLRYYYPPINLPKYIVRTYNRDHITAKTLDIVLSDMVTDSIPNTTLLDYMIENGKKLYILDKLLPCAPDSVKFGYSKEQTKWVKNNEFMMWKEVFSSKLYDTDYKAFQKFISFSPNSPDMPYEAPGNTGSFIGYQIVKAFMERNPNYKMEQLLAISDAKQILVQSRYKPKK